jgi:hypothetical protein
MLGQAKGVNPAGVVAASRLHSGARIAGAGG